MGWLTGYTYRRALSLDCTKTAVSLTDFPVLVKLTSTNFDFTKTRSDGYDIRFTSSDGTTQLKYEVERFSVTTLAAEIWVKIPTYSSTSDTLIYMYYGKSDATSGEDAINVWDSNNKLVLHPIGPNGSMGILDESGRGHVIVKNGVAELITSQKKFGNTSINFANTVTNYLTISDNVTDFVLGSQDFTIGFWCYPQSNSWFLVVEHDTQGALYGWGVMYRTHVVNAWSLFLANGSRIQINFAEAVTVGAWQYIEFCRSGNNFYGFKNGVQMGSTVVNSLAVAGPTTNPLYIGGDGGYKCHAYIDSLFIKKGVADHTSNFTTPTEPPTADAYTVLLLNMESRDSLNANNILYKYNARVKTGQAKVGSVSVYSDGTGDYSSIADSDDWYFGDGNFTLEMWVRFTAVTAHQGLYGQYQDADNVWFLAWLNTGLLRFKTRFAATEINHDSSSWTPRINTWYYVVVTRSGNTLYFYIDNVAYGSSSFTETMANIGGELSVGAIKDTAGTWYPLFGYYDEIRVTKGLSRSTDWLMANNHVANSRVVIYGEETSSTSLEWLSDFGKRQKIEIDPTTIVSDEVGNFAFVDLKDFAAINPADIQSDGRDVRFTDSDGVTPLAFEKFWYRQNKYTVLLLHGKDTGTIIDSSTYAKAVTAAGNAQYNLGKKKLGSGSISFDGTGDYLSVADSLDWRVDNEDWTIDFWVNFKVITGAQQIIGQYVDANN